MTKLEDLRGITPRSNGTRKLSSITKIARHHSATTSGDWHSFWDYWKNTKKWGTGGYHEIILRDGTVQICYDPEEITNGVGKHNSYIYHICLVGNGKFTKAQEKAWEERALYNMKKFGLKIPDVRGHNEFSGTNTSCPAINMNTVRKNLARKTPKTYNLYTVKKGDTLSEICKTNDKNVLRNVGLLNNVRDINLIRVGQVLKIPVNVVK